MNANEFSIWQRYHGARFGMWASWLAKMPQKSTEARPSQADTLAAIFETLADVDLVDAREASRQFAIGELPEIDKVDEHARRVRAEALKIGEKRKAKEYPAIKAREPGREPRPPSCLRCRDASVAQITVWHPDTVREARDPEYAKHIADGTRPVFTTAVACDCARGRRHSQASGLRQFNSRMLEVENRLYMKVRRQELVEWANREDRNSFDCDEPREYGDTND